ncbi:NAD(P)/FAD-dependent oxidoreductase [Clostridium sp.]|uniref:NAD(P)/FAD-dependent oxidoreductase n=1 Tax=Clostridium sp. TaxID=1506 RepID=UPI003463C727
MRKFNVAVIGAGAGGLTIGYTAKGFNKSVVLIDKNRPGGECTFGGCVPSKALINIANDIYKAKEYTNIVPDTYHILKKVREVVENVYEAKSIEVLKEDGIEYINGFCKFINKNTLEVGGEIIKADKIFISTGSSPKIPSIEGIDNIEYLTNENIFYKEKLPESIIVLGAGSVGVELSQAMNRLGIRVYLVEKNPYIMHKEEKELSKALEEVLVDEGVNIYTSCNSRKIENYKDGVRLTFEKDNKDHSIYAENILIAIGRVPNIKGLNLEGVDIDYDSKRVKVNKYLETSVKGVYAVGDVVGPYLFSHMANIQGITAVKNALLPIKEKMDYSKVAWCTLSEPELARAGLREDEARETYGDSIRVYIEDYKNLDRAKFKNNPKGVVKIICDKKGYILGASILGDRAGEIISEVQTIKSLGINLKKLTKVIHPYPTYSEVLVKISKKLYVDTLLDNPIIKNFRR